MFKYIRDPLFIIGWLLYFVNRYIIKTHLPEKEIFFNGYFSDLLLIPCALPLLLFIYRLLEIRHSDSPPSLQEVIFHLNIWSVLFEGIGPIFLTTAISDIGDVIAYWIGGIATWMLWKKLYTI